jgi:uncharacterized damage-inducible protein DinB
VTTSVLGPAFAHHIWATERLIDACAALSPEQLKIRVPGTYGSIIDTLRHLVRADGWYLSFFSVEPRALIDDETSLSELRSVITSNGAAWTAQLAREVDPDEDVVEPGDDGSEYHVPKGIRLAQVILHGADHRSQVRTALSSLGLTPAEDDLWSFAEATGRAQEVPAPAP